MFLECLTVDHAGKAAKPLREMVPDWCLPSLDSIDVNITVFSCPHV